MTLLTWSEMKTIIKNDLDLDDETFINDTMLMAWVNNGINEAEQHILGIVGDDYFLQTETLAITNGTSEYDLPSNILGYKIRKVFYDNGSTKYEIPRIRDLRVIPHIDTADDYRYVIISNSSGVAKIKLYPAAQETSSNITLWFIGNANLIDADADTINIPEAVNFLISYVKLECLRKEGDPRAATMEMERERQRQLMIETLTNMVPDENNEMLIDTTLYDEMN